VLDRTDGGRWELSGRPSADQYAEANRFPIVVPDRDGRPIILSGHHRTAAALIEGRPVRARIVAGADSYFVTPTVAVDRRVSAAVDDGLAQLVPGGHVVVPDLELARAVLERARVCDDDIRAAVQSAARRLTGG
jgi:hypothetical protein